MLYTFLASILVVLSIALVIIMGDLNNEILQQIQCPICFKYMLPPMYLCETGHTICNSCIPKLKRCPTCRAPLKRTRNYLLESLIRMLINFPCKYTNFGCQETFALNDLTEHENMCTFRFYKCLFDKETGACDWEGRRNEIYSHVLQHHQNNIHYEILENTCNLDVQHEKFMLCVFGDHFYVHKKIFADMFYVMVQYIGKFDIASNFVFEVVIITEEPHRSMVFKEPCSHDSKSIDFVIQSHLGGCIHIPLTLLDRYKDDRGDVKYKISISYKG